MFHPSVGWSQRARDQEMQGQRREREQRELDIRQAAACFAGVDASMLPSPRDLQHAIDWLFALLEPVPDGPGSMSVATATVLVVCKIYDEGTPVAAFDDTLKAVGAQETVTARQFYHWIVLMFGDCKEDEFITGVVKFGEAAKQMKVLNAQQARTTMTAKLELLLR